MLNGFDNHIQIAANTNISVAILSQEQYSTLYSDILLSRDAPYNATAIYNGSNINFWFNDSRGNYLYLIYNNDGKLGPFSIKPHITATCTSLCGAWTTPMNVSSGWLDGQLYDTFDNHIEATANTPISIGIMTQEQYSILQADMLFGLNIPYQTIAFYNGTSINVWFNDSRGCNDYMYVVYNDDHKLGAFSINPNITADYDPTHSSLTGVCADE